MASENDIGLVQVSNLGYSHLRLPSAPGGRIIVNARVDNL